MNSEQHVYEDAMDTAFVFNSIWGYTITLITVLEFAFSP